MLAGNANGESPSDKTLPSGPSALTFTVVGERENSLTKALWAAAQSSSNSNTRLRLEDRTGGRQDPYPATPLRAAYLCILGRCSLPITDPRDIKITKNRMSQELNE